MTTTCARAFDAAPQQRASAYLCSIYSSQLACLVHAALNTANFQMTLSNSTARRLSNFRRHSGVIRASVSALYRVPLGHRRCIDDVNPPPNVRSPRGCNAGAVRGRSAARCRADRGATIPAPRPAAPARCRPVSWPWLSGLRKLAGPALD